jgi:streptomycin 6-kinase
VLAHGDAHPWNALLVPESQPQRFKLIDPDGLNIEPAYDLGILMREWTDELLVGEPLRLGLQRCNQIAAQTGVAPEPIWQWGFIERVSTGLLCLQVGLPGGQDMLAVARHWVAAS